MAYNQLYGSMTLVDISNDTVTAETLAEGITAHDRNGNAITGIAYSVGSEESIPSYVTDEANRLVDVVLSHQTDNCIRFLVMSDSHHSNDVTNTLNGNKHAGQAAKIIADSIGLDFAVFLGDYTAGDANTTIATGINDIKTVNSLIADAFNGIPNFRTVGNHDGLWSSETLNGETLSNALLTGLIGSHMRHNDKGGSYGYADFEQYKLRVICLNTADGAAENVSNEQLKWFAETALDFTDKQDWQFMIFSHHPLDWGNVYKTSNILGAYINGSSYSSGNISINYSGLNEAVFIANFHGHTHCYKVDNLHVISNSVGTAYDAQRIATPNMCFYRNNEYGANDGTEYYGIEFGEVVTYPKVANSATDTSFCVVTVDFIEGKIYADHYGAGYDREIEYMANAITGYTNVIPTSQEYSSTAPYNDIGYKDGVYVSSSAAPYDGVDSAFFATGFIPYTIPTTGLPQSIYIKGAAWTSESHARFYFFDSNKTAIHLFINGNGTGANSLSQYFTIETLGESYYKLTPIASSSGTTSALISTSANTQYTNYIRLSLKGSGENVIITIDEPIE